jgi:hypothetical protein
MRQAAGYKVQAARYRQQSSHRSDTNAKWLVEKTKQGISAAGSEKSIVKKEAPCLQDAV